VRTLPVELPVLNNFPSRMPARPSPAPSHPRGRVLQAVQGCAAAEEPDVGFGGVFPLRVMHSYGETLERPNRSILTPWQQRVDVVIEWCQLEEPPSLRGACARGWQCGCRVCEESQGGHSQFWPFPAAPQPGTAQPLSPAGGASK